MRVETKVEHAELVYPLLMIDPESESIYLMTDCYVGTKLAHGALEENKHVVAGTHKTSWADEEFLPFFGTVKLSNTP